MSTVLNVLSTEITPIPSWISSILGGYYNNTLCNGGTWMLVLWKMFHVLYNGLMHMYLKKIRTKEYVRTRLTNSLWYCSFFSSTLAYYLVTFDSNKMDLLRASHVTLDTNLPIQMVLTYTIICTFYLHSALVEGIQNGSLHLFIKFLLLVVICVFSYILRLLQIPFTLSALIAISVISEELTKVFYSLLRQDNKINQVFVGMLYFFNLALFILTHLIIVPSIFIIPLGKRLASNNGDSILILLFLSMLLWICSAVCSSMLSKSVFHWVYHAREELIQGEEEEEKMKQNMHCPGNIIECSMFPARTDDAYVLYVLRSEIKERKKEMEARKKPKNKNMMLIQTLKCMMAIKEKLSKRRLKDSSSDSDDPSDAEGEPEDGDDTVNADETLNVAEDSGDASAPAMESNEFQSENRSVEIDRDLDSDDATALNDSNNGQPVHCGESENESSQDNGAHGTARDGEEKADDTKPANDNSEAEIDIGTVRVAGKGLDDALEIGVEAHLSAQSEATENVKPGETCEEDEKKPQEELQESRSNVKIQGSFKRSDSDDGSKIAFHGAF